MAFVPTADAEPIPGYRLVAKLGVGGYGEVWKVIAPGGLAKAVKIVYGDMSGSRAEQELKALGRIKEVRHPFLLSLERIEVVDGQLFIVTELADGCLLDRFFDCRKKGMKGIPRDELLGHLRDAADALDYMGESHGLQHLDIKPQNLLLVGNRIKVADFGLVKDLVGTSATAPGGVTPVYATPEAFDGRVSRYSDQYSLAIVYQEMLTGVRPFPGTTLMQLMAQHVNSPPLLTPLPGNDRAAIGKALSKAPEHRFPSCLKMVDALLAGGRDADALTAAPSQRLAPREQAPPAAADVGPGPTDTSAGLGVPTVAKALTPVGRGVEGAPRPSAVDAAGGKAGLRPTLFLGIGGLAAATLRRLKKRFRARYGDPADAPIFRFLQVDTDREDLRRARLGDAAESLDVVETLLTPLHLPEHYRGDSKNLLRWLDRRWFYGIPRSLQTEGLRPLGRLALVDNAAEILSHVRDLLAQITDAEAVEKTTRITGAGIRDTTPRVFVVASVAGGAGGGMVLDMAYAVRQALQELGLSARGLCGVLLYATSLKPEDQEMARVNAYAALSELAHFSGADAVYPGDPDSDLAPCPKACGPFEETYLVHLGEQLGAAEAEAATEKLAEYLFLDASPNGGAFLDEYRRQTHAAPRDPFTLRTFGLSRVGTEGERPLDLATKLLCLRLTDKWLTGPREAEAKFLEREAGRQAVAQGLEVAALVGRMWAAVDAAPGESPDDYLAGLLARAAEAARGDQPASLLAPIDRILAPKRDTKSAETTASPFQAAVRKSAVEHGGAVARALVDWLTRLVETPGKRFKAAGRAAAFLDREFAALAETIRGRLARLGERRHALRQLIETEKSGGTGIGFGWLGRALGKAAPNPEDAVRDYCRLWLQEAAEEGALVVLGAVGQELGAFRQQLTVGRQRLEKFAGQFRPAAANDLPPNAATVPLGRAGRGDEEDERPETEGAGLPPELLFRFDRSFQTDVLERRGGMWGLFAREEDPTRREAESPKAARETLAEDLLIRARSAIQGEMKELNAAQLFLQSCGGPEKARPVFLAQVDAARPRLRGPAGWEHLVLALPEGPSGETLSGMVAAARSDVPASVVHTEEEVILCYEAARCPLRDMARALTGPAGVPLDLVRRVMTRRDVAWDLPEPGPA